MSGVNTYTGGTFINGGTLAIFKDSNLGGASGSLNFNGGTLKTRAGVTSARSGVLGSDGGIIDSSKFHSKLSGVFSGSGGLTKLGDGKLTLTGLNTYTGGTSINGGTLSISKDENLGAASGPLNISNGATLKTLAAITSARSGAFGADGATIDTNAFDSTLSGVFSGSGGLTKLGDGALTLTGVNTYTGGTSITGGVLAISRDDNLGAATGPLNISNGATLRTLAAITSARSGVFGAGGAMIDTNSFDSTLSGKFSGIGGLTKVGEGALTLAGVNAYTGGTSITGGVLAISKDDNLGAASGPLNISNGATLKTLASITSARSGVFDAGGATIDTNAFDSTLSGAISGSGGLTKIGDGALTLTGVNTFTGSTTVNAGSLGVNGSIASSNTIINTGALVVGMGTIGGDLTNNGFVAPGNIPVPGGLQAMLSSSGFNSITLNVTNIPAAQLTLNVKGNYTQSASGTLVIAYGGSAPTQHTLLAVQGQANLDGTLQLIQVNGARLKTGDTVPIVTATGGVNGKFANVAGANLLGEGVNVSYAVPNEVVLQLTGGNTTATLQQLGSLPPNVRSTARALDSAAGDPRAAAIFSAIANDTPSQLLNDVQLISGQQLTAQNAIGNSVSNVHISNTAHRGEALRDGATGFSSLGFHSAGTPYDSAAGYAGPAGPADKDSKEIAPPPNPRWGGFISGAGQWNRVGDTEQARGFSLDSGGITLGIDYKFTPNFVAGIFLGYTHTSIDIGEGGGIGVDVGKVGIYSTFFTGGFYLDTAVQGGYDGYSSRRAGLGGFARSDTHGGDLNVIVSPGYDFKVGALTIGPTASFQYGYQATNRFTEHDSLAPLSVDPTHTNSFISTIGMKATYDWKIGSQIIRPELRLSYQHEYGDVSTDVTSRLASGAGDAFTVTGPEIGRDSMLLGAGFAVVWSDRVTSYVYYDGEFFRTNYDSSAVSGGFRITF